MIFERPAQVPGERALQTSTGFCLPPSGLPPHFQLLCPLDGSHVPLILNHVDCHIRAVMC